MNRTPKFSSGISAATALVILLLLGGTKYRQPLTASLSSLSQAVSNAPPLLALVCIVALVVALLFLLDRPTERRRELEASLLKAFLDHIPDNVFFKSRASRFVRISRAMAVYCGMKDPSEAIGKTDADIFSPEHANKAFKDEQEIMRTGEPMVGVEELEVWPDGRTTWVLTTKVPLWDRKGRVIGTMGIAHNVTDRKLAENNIRHMALHDALTGLPNRRQLEQRLSEALSASRRESKQIAVLLLDLDRFKDVNDTFGHHLGDRLLDVVAKRLTSCLRSSDFIARLGGDEFVIVLTMVELRSNVEEVAQKVLSAFREPFEIEDHRLHIRASIGISMFPTDADLPDTLIQFADAAMYEAKKNGRGAHSYFSHEINNAAISRHTLRTELYRARDEGEFLLHYQPFVSTEDGRVTGFEALIRWNHPTRGLLAPGDFLLHLEDMGLSVEIGHWVLQTACHQCGRWREEGFPDVRVSVNLSAQQFYRCDIVSSIAQALRDFDLPGRCLELELTETITLDTSENTLKIIEDLKALGVCLSLDDFGTGWSSLSYLSRFPLDRLKIDGSFY